MSIKIYKLTIDKASEILAGLTKEYTQNYLATWHKMDRQHWAALHLGFVAALKQCGYDEKEMEQVLEQTQKRLADYK